MSKKRKSYEQKEKKKLCTKKRKVMLRPDVQVMKTSRWTFHSTPFLLLTFHHTTYHSGLLTMFMKITMLMIEDHAIHSK